MRYLILAWRLLWFPVIYGAKLLMCFGVLCAAGWVAARTAWIESYV